MRKKFGILLLTSCLGSINANAQQRAVTYDCVFQSVLAGFDTPAEDIIKSTGLPALVRGSIDLHTGRGYHASLSGYTGGINLSVFSDELGAGAVAKSEMGQPIEVTLYGTINQKKAIVTCNPK